MRLSALFIASLLGLACAPRPSGGALAPLPAGTFHVSSLGSSPTGGSRYLARVSSPSGACAFEFSIDHTDPGPGELFTFSPILLARHGDTDCTAFLEALAPDLGFKGPLPAATPVPKLETTVAVLGSHQSRTGPPLAGGSFSSHPRGTWVATKLFLAEGEAEVYFNYSPAEGIGEFSKKDDDYATVVILELAKLLLPFRPAA